MTESEKKKHFRISKRSSKIIIMEAIYLQGILDAIEGNIPHDSSESLQYFAYKRVQEILTPKDTAKCQK